MNNYNNGPIPPYQNNNGYQPYYTPPVRHPGSGFATASMVLGIIAVLSAFFGTVYIPVICGGLAIILGLLSKGSDKVMLPNSKVGVMTAIAGFIVNFLILAFFAMQLITDTSFRENFHSDLNQYYQYFYGESFDDAWKQIEDAYGSNGTDMSIHLESTDHITE